MERILSPVASPSTEAVHQLGAVMQEMMALIGEASERASLRLIQRSGLTPPQIITLYVLNRRGAQTVSALADHLHLTRGAVSHLVDRMVGLQLVTREEVAQDRRHKRIEMSRRGRSFLERLRHGRQNDFARALANLQPDTRRQLGVVLGTVNAELRSRLAESRRRGAS